MVYTNVGYEVQVQECFARNFYMGKFNFEWVGRPENNNLNCCLQEYWKRIMWGNCHYFLYSLGWSYQTTDEI